MVLKLEVLLPILTFQEKHIHSVTIPPPHFIYMLFFPQEISLHLRRLHFVMKGYLTYEKIEKTYCSL